MAEYSKIGFKCNFEDVLQWVSQSVIGIPLRRMPNFIYVRVTMIFPDPLSLIECSVCQVLVFPANLSSPIKFTDWYTRKFMIK